MATAAETPTLETGDDDGPRFRPRGRILPAGEVDVWHTGQSYLEAAKREARRIRADAGGVYRQEKQRGFEEGRREGAEAATRLLAETAVKADRYLADADGQLVDLAMAILQRILGDIDAGQLVLKAVHHALSKQRKDQLLTLHVSPEMIDQLQAQIAESFDDESRQLITIEADPKLAVGECRAATDVGFVELGIDAQLRALHQGLRDNLKRSAQD